MTGARALEPELGEKTRELDQAVYRSWGVRAWAFRKIGETGTPDAVKLLGDVLD